MRKFIILCSALAVMLSVSLTAFAFQPNKESMLTEVGGWQYGTFNSEITYTWHAEACPTCGINGYYLAPSEYTEEYTSISFGDIFAVADATNSNLRTHNDSGIVAYFDWIDPHEQSDHRIGQFVKTDYDEVFTITPKNTEAFRGVIGGFKRVTENGGISPFWERVEPLYRQYCNSVNAVALYALTTFSIPLYDDEILSYNEAVMSSAYEKGLADGSANADLINGVDGIMNGIIQGFTPVLEFEILGISTISIVALFVSFAFIMLLVKVLRG